MVSVIKKIIRGNKGFPNNPLLPLLHYKKVLSAGDPEKIRLIFHSNGWKNSWVNSIYGYHHFHSNTHEALGIATGSCDVQIGGEEGEIFRVEAGDVLLIPAGVSHKNAGSSDDFVCVGSYPTDTPYDMHRGKENERPQVDRAIAEVPLPENDPVFGKEGPLIDNWM